ncbi:hypothetical protein EW146_g7892 [Bondarzewia mesenterica]|uniref:Uncharacterized protein n=1 Tax=Bondarzewia mesenterica TaxID=1095465 RepID=A0A4S4LIL3_9AGAM|nr:hypothetical protein EW146_g7892 [Bondarzewia mesenterica]
MTLLSARQDTRTGTDVSDVLMSTSGLFQSDDSWMFRGAVVDSVLVFEEREGWHHSNGVSPDAEATLHVPYILDAFPRTVFVCAGLLWAKHEPPPVVGEDHAFVISSVGRRTSSHCRSPSHFTKHTLAHTSPSATRCMPDVSQSIRDINHVALGMGPRLSSPDVRNGHQKKSKTHTDGWYPREFRDLAVDDFTLVIGFHEIRADQIPLSKLE